MVDNHIDGLVQERRNSIADALESRLSCANPSINGLVQARHKSIADAPWSYVFLAPTHRHIP